MIKRHINTYVFSIYMSEGQERENPNSKLIADSKSLNSSVFSLMRIQLLSSLSVVGSDGATYRELKAWLDLSDGALYSNVKALEETGYVKSEKISLEGKELESYRLTEEGRAQWRQVKMWLCDFLHCGGKK